MNLFYSLRLCAFAFFIFFYSNVYAEIIETSQFSDVLSHVENSQTFVFVDIDDTLINTSSMLGNTPWWNYFISKISKAKLPQTTMQQEVYPLIRKILLKVPMQLVEDHSEAIIKKLQAQHTIVLGLTGRCVNADYIPMADRLTYEILKLNSIDFTLSASLAFHEESYNDFFSYNIIFTSFQDKGPYLKIFLNTLKVKPKKVVFIDDNLRQLESVEKVLEELNIPFVGLRYGHLDHFHACFDPFIANIQLQELVNKDIVLSDAEAAKMAKHNSELNQDFFLDELINQWKVKK